MNLEQVKKLEDLKAVSKKLQDQVLVQINNRKKDKKAEAVRDFTEYFKAANFVVRENLTFTDNVIATYNTTTITLTLPQLNVAVIGSYTFFDLTINSGNSKREYRILLLEKNRSESPVGGHTKFSTQKPVDQLSEDIKAAEQEITYFEKRVEDVKTAQLVFVYHDPAQGSPRHYDKSFTSFKELLQDIFK